MDFLFTFARTLIQVLTFAIFARVMLSWVVMFGINVGPDNPIVAMLYQITEPVLGPLRRTLPRFGLLDLSPLVALVLLQLIAGMLGGRA